MVCLPTDCQVGCHGREAGINGRRNKSGKRDSNPLLTAWDPPAGGLPGGNRSREEKPGLMEDEKRAENGTRTRYLQLGIRQPADYQVSYFPFIFTVVSLNLQFWIRLD